VSDANFYRKRGFIYRDKGQYSEAIWDLKMALSLEPEDSVVKNELHKLECSLIICINGGVLMRINSGTFIMGSPAGEKGSRPGDAQHQVTVSSFYMGIYPVTQMEYQEIMGVNPSHFKGNDLPVENVSWYEAIEYCNRLSLKEGLSPAYSGDWNNYVLNRTTNAYRLPTEAEWEYACRAGTTTPYSTGIKITKKQAAFSGEIFSRRTPRVGSFSANPWGLYDMHGNVNEWCWDRYGIYKKEAQTDPEGPDSGNRRVIRGGSWMQIVDACRSSFRNSFDPSGRHESIGFRLARG